MLERGQVEIGLRGKGTSGRSWWYSLPRSRSERRKRDPGGRRVYVRGLAGCQEQGRGDTEEAPSEFHSALWFTRHTAYLCCITSYHTHGGLKQHVFPISQFTVESHTVQQGLTSLKPRSRLAGSSSGGSIRKRSTSTPSGWIEFISCGCVTEVPVAVFFLFVLGGLVFALWSFQNLSSLTRGWTQAGVMEVLSPNCWTARELLHVLIIDYSCAMNIGVHVSFWLSIFAGYVPRSGITGSYGNSAFSFSRNLHAALQSGCTNWHSHQHSRRAPLSLHPLQHFHSN